MVHAIYILWVELGHCHFSLGKCKLQLKMGYNGALCFGFSLTFSLRSVVVLDCIECRPILCQMKIACIAVKKLSMFLLVSAATGTCTFTKMTRYAQWYNYISTHILVFQNVPIIKFLITKTCYVKICNLLIIMDQQQ